MLTAESLRTELCTEGTAGLRDREVVAAERMWQELWPWAEKGREERSGDRVRRSDGSYPAEPPKATLEEGSATGPGLENAFHLPSAPPPSPICWPLVGRVGRPFTPRRIH